MDDKKKLLVQKHMRRVCLICHKKVSEHSVDDLAHCMNDLDSQKHYLRLWLELKVDMLMEQDKKSKR